MKDYKPRPIGTITDKYGKKTAIYSTGDTEEE